MTKIINLIAGPGAGKSTIASDLFAAMKWRNINCELVTEFPKELHWDGRTEVMKDQVYMLAKQNRRQARLVGKVDYVITDSPLIMYPTYDTFYGESYTELTRKMFSMYDNVNIIIRRTKDYHNVGRTQTFEEAVELDEKIFKFMDQEQLPYHAVRGDEMAKYEIMDILGI